MIRLSYQGRILDFLNQPLVSIGISLVYAVSLLMIGAISVAKQKRLWMLFPGLCIPVMVAPLLLVTPIGPRCFYGCYLLMMLYACRLLNEILTEKQVAGKKSWKLSLYGLCVICFAVSFSIFFPIHKVDRERNTFAQAQARNGETTILFTAFPDTTYLWCAEPNTELWATRYKRFYHLPEDVSFQYVDLDSFETYYADYEERSASH